MVLYLILETEGELKQIGIYESLLKVLHLPLDKAQMS